MASCCGHLTRPHAWAYPGYRLVPVAKVHVAAPGRQVLRQVIDHVESQLAFFNFAYPYPVYSFPDSVFAFLKFVQRSRVHNHFSCWLGS